MKKAVKRFLLACFAVVCAVGMFPNVANAEQVELETQYASDVQQRYLNRHQLEMQQYEEMYAAYGAEEKVSGDYTYYVESDGTATITKYNGTAAKVTIPAKLAGKSVKKVAANAIAYNDTVTSVTVSEGIVSLGQYWIYSCKNLQSVSLPSTVKIVAVGEWEDTRAASGMILFCDKFTTITVSDKNPNLTVINGDLYSKDKKTFYMHPSGSTKTKLTISSGVTTIAPYACAYSKNLTEVVFPDTVVTISDSAFASVWLTSLTLPKNCKTIDDYAFEYGSFKSVNIPAATTSVSGSAFLGSFTLTTFTVNSANKVYTVKNNCLYDKTTNTVVAYPSSNAATTVTVPSGTKIIGEYAYSCARFMEKVVIPNTVETIQESAFFICDALTEITIPASVKKMEYAAVSYSNNLKKITFKGNAPKLDDSVFSTLSATVYYPAGNSTWNNVKGKNYGAKSLTWKTSSSSTAVPATPAKPYKVANVVSGVHVYWKAVANAEKYGLWRSENGANGTYKWIANPTVAHFTDTSVTSGKTYYYKVSAMKPDGSHTAKSEAIGVIYVATPDITSRINKSSGIQLGWNKVAGATGYAIYRKSYSGTDAWARVKTISGNATFTWIDTSVKSEHGKIYKYTVRALAGSDKGTLSGCRNAGRTMTRLMTNYLSSAAKASSTSIKCSWGTTSAATGYEVRFMVGSTVYKTFTVEGYKTGAKTFTGLKSGKTYKIQIRTYKTVSGVGSFYSAWSEAKSVGL